HESHVFPIVALPLALIIIPQMLGDVLDSVDRLESFVSECFPNVSRCSRFGFPLRAVRAEWVVLLSMKCYFIFTSLRSARSILRRENVQNGE
ncbi:hypothetical protein PENTCL1PPCAC_23972, partial [Pristionchus entomophagus]